MNFENRKTSEPHTLLLNFMYKTKLSRNNKYVAISNNMQYTWKNIFKSHAKTINN